jgi:uncharacterized membrane protein YfcA
MVFNHIVYLVFYAISGLLIGLVGGMVGLVLGVVRFPIVVTAETSASIVAGTNLGISTLGSIAAAIKHYKQNNIDFHVFKIMAITGSIGAFIGSFLTGFVPMTFLLCIIGIIVSYEAFILLSKNSKQIKIKIKTKDKEDHFDNNNDDHYGYDENEIDIKNDKIKSKFNTYLTESLIGFAIGFLGGLVGLVLGSIRMPAMISILKLKPKIAVGTNLATASVMGSVGMIGHVLNHNIDYIILMVMGPGAMLGAYIGAKFTNRFNDTTLKFIIGLVLVIVAISMFWRVFSMVTI